MLWKTYLCVICVGKLHCLGRYVWHFYPLASLTWSLFSVCLSAEVYVHEEEWSAPKTLRGKEKIEGKNCMTVS